MGNVACYGSEDKLMDCNYHTFTSEDDHINDMWINCDIIDSPSSNTDKQSTVALAVSIIGLGINLLVIGFLIGYNILCRHKNKACNDGR